MAISSPWPDAYVAATLAARLRTASSPLWLFAMQTDAFASAVWREGRAAAEALERAVTERFYAAAAETLREDDAAVHAYGSNRYAVVLFARRGSDERSALHARRRALEEIERTMRERLAVPLVAGWRLLRPGDDLPNAMDEEIERAHRRGARRAYATLLHDLATPVAAVVSAVSGVLDGRFDERTSNRFLGTALSEATRVGRMMREFIALERDDAAAVTDLTRALDRAVAAVEPLASERGIALRMCSRSSCEPVAFDVSEDTAVALLVNLLENAVKHGRENGTVKARLRTLGGTCEIEIDDDGPGVRDSDRERIFEFGRRGATAAVGSGIGLAHARALVDALDGEICVQRSPMGGARFAVRLPLARGRRSARDAAPA